MADSAKKPKKARSEESRKRKRETDSERNRTRVPLGQAFSRWRELKSSTGCNSDAHLAFLLMDYYQHQKVTSTPSKGHKGPPKPLVSSIQESDRDRDEDFPVPDVQPFITETEEVDVLESRMTDYTLKSRMCSVFDCDSWRRKVQRFKLPQDPERRLEWVQFLFDVNGQRLKESSWTDITICCEHFTADCFVQQTPETATVQLKSSAVPSLCIKSEPDESEPPQTVSADEDHSTTTGVADIKEESEPTDETEESGDESEIDSDEDWKPVNERLLNKKLHNDESDEESEGDSDNNPPLPPKHSQLCTDCGMFFNKQKPHTCEHIIKPFSCNICGKRCVSEVALTSHSRIHDANYEHTCKYCHVTFKTKVDKRTHEQIHLSEGKPYKCPDCPETFATYKECRIHLEDHRGPRKLKCDFCGVEFVTPLSLQRHLTVHTGMKPFKCSVCQRGFKQASHLKSHMRLHTGERPYKCQHCDKCFNHNVSLKSHVQRYHSSNSGREQKTETINQRESDAADAESNGNKRGVDSGLDNAEEEQEMEEEEPKEKKNKRSTGRPIGRPKRYESDSVALDVQVEGQCSNRRTEKRQAQKVKKTQRGDEFSEDQPSDSDMSFDSAEEEEEETSKKAIKNTARSRNRSKTSNSDSDFDPEERKEKRSSSQNSGRGSGRRRGRPRKNLVV
ncbi:RE1-silencing transcription factor B-like isoform X6 [Dicentrarchus labrax]|uniref:RE1-silencing transcription factor B-like isoform X6 n=1 Tax=Dicentrarchus labrax TaxID=13489 RepID=UPI0021F544B4|nr:RE1-silencing transcription factor B-like isoform X6 [Dicentrarchus labrax]